jgi:predicted RNA-binding protein YlqC (UPF0109 family)
VKEVLEYIARHLVDDPDSVEVTEEVSGSGSVTLRLKVAPDDMGKVIGRGGRIARAIRAVVRASAARTDTHVSVEIVE